MIAAIQDRSQDLFSWLIGSDVLIAEQVEIQKETHQMTKANFFVNSRRSSRIKKKSGHILSHLELMCSRGMVVEIVARLTDNTTNAQAVS